jgi:hypothetical protein
MKGCLNAPLTAGLGLRKITAKHEETSRDAPNRQHNKDLFCH